MSFAMGFVAFVLGSVLVGVCLEAIPGPGGEGASAPPDHGDGHGGH